MDHKFTEADIGKKVIYKKDFGENEEGIIKKVTTNTVFVVYPGDNDAKKEHWENYTAAATNPEDLILKDKYND